MTIGLNEKEITAILTKNSSVESKDLFEAIAKVITENNKKLEEDLNEPKPATFG